MGQPAYTGPAVESVSRIKSFCYCCPSSDMALVWRQLKTSGAGGGLGTAVVQESFPVLGSQGQDYSAGGGEPRGQGLKVLGVRESPLQASPASAGLRAPLCVDVCEPWPFCVGCLCPDRQGWWVRPHAMTSFQVSDLAGPGVGLRRIFGP